VSLRRNCDRLRLKLGHELGKGCGLVRVKGSGVRVRVGVRVGDIVLGSRLGL